MKLVITGRAGGVPSATVGGTFDVPSAFAGAPLGEGELATGVAFLEPGDEELVVIVLVIPPQPASKKRQKSNKVVQIPGPRRTKHLKNRGRLAARKKREFHIRVVQKLTSC